MIDQTPRPDPDTLPRAAYPDDPRLFGPPGYALVPHHGSPAMPPPGPPPAPPAAGDLRTSSTPFRPSGFWQSLTSVEQTDFALAAEEVVLPVGHLLWREGDVADHLLVVLSGWVKVCVERDGWERIIAVRGSGDLLGERAALLLKRRSAACVALDTLRFLRMSTRDFAAFLSAHPRLLAVLEHQVYGRLTEEPCVRPYVPVQTSAAPPYEQPTSPDPYTPVAFPTPAPYPPPAPGPSAAAVPPAPQLSTTPSWAGQMCSVLFTDIVGFSGAHRRDDDRLRMRRVMYDMVRTALADSNVPWEALHREDRGDGALIVVPPGLPTRSVVDPMLARLTTALRRYNRAAGEAVRFQLRVALHVGPVTPDAEGVSGWAIIHAARLLEAGVFKKWMAETQADLGFIASAFVYETVIAQARGEVNPARFQRLTCQVKESEVTGWMHLSGATP